MYHSHSENLILCVTPLHMVIAEKIIELRANQDFDLVVLALNDNDKYRYYFRRLSKICNNCIYYHYARNPGIKGFINFKKLYKSHNLHYEYENIFLASITSRNFQYIVSKNKKANIFTFDDGTMNIIPTSKYYTSPTPKLLKKLVWRALGVKLYANDIKNKSKLHYSIYKNIPNIINNVKYINIYQASNTLPNKKFTNTRKIYLGQPLTELSGHLNQLYILKTLKNIGIDDYLPHPRERDVPSKQLNVIETQLIIEDYLKELLKQSPNTKFEIYSFISSALLNITPSTQVSLYFIYDEVLFEKYHSFYSLVKNKFDIGVIYPD